LDGEWDANTAFQCIKFESSKWPIITTSSGFRAIITKEEYESVVKDVLCLERLQQLPYTGVHCHSHGGVNPAVRIGDIRHLIHIDRRRCIIWFVHSVIRHVEEEWLRRMAVDKGNSLSGKCVGQVTGFVSECRVPHNLRVVINGLWPKEAEEFIKAALGGPKAWCSTQMPFADHPGNVTSRLE
jgi:hypothetical protein